MMLAASGLVVIARKNRGAGSLNDRQAFKTVDDQARNAICLQNDLLEG